MVNSNEISATELAALAGAIRSGPRGMIRALLPLLDDPLRAERLLLRILVEVRDGESPAIVGLHSLPRAQRDRVLLDLAHHSRETVRFNLFRLLTRNYQLPEPYSLRPPLSSSVVDSLTENGLADSSARVRERAAAFAVGTGRVVPVLEQLMAGADDSVESCRCYCLLALGLARDEHSLETLKRAFDCASEAVAVAAIWALARRCDGVPILLEALIKEPERQHNEIIVKAIGSMMAFHEPDREHQTRFAAVAQEPVSRCSVKGG